MPLVIHYRPFNRFYSPINDVAYSLDSKVELLNGRECRRLYPETPSRVEHRYWVDPRRDWIVIRMETYYARKLASRIDVQYAEAPDANWVPQAWTHSLYRDAQLTETSTATVLNTETDAELPNSAFVVEFPTGTLVTDRLNSKPVVYLVRANNGKRIVTPEERRHRLQYERYINTESGEAVDLSDPPRRRRAP
jgi:hypothetical protein